MIKKNELKKQIGAKLREIRTALKLTHEEMAGRFCIERTTYSKNELGNSLPGYQTLHILCTGLNISLDWLIGNKGPRYNTEKETLRETLPEKTSPGQTQVIHLDEEQQELIAAMAQIPLLKHEILSFYLRFKESNSELVARYKNKEDLPPQ